MMAPEPRFGLGEKVLCMDEPLIYEAKCLKHSVTKNNHVRYFVHYIGWNKIWDKWVPESQLLEYNEENIQKQKEAQLTHSVRPTKAKIAKNSDKALGTSKTSSETQPTVALAASGSNQAKKKRSHLDTTVEMETGPAKVEVKIKIPEELRVWLIDDRDLIVQQQKLVILPAKLTVDQILDGAKKKRKHMMFVEITEAIKEYFNLTLSSKLLYAWERAQFDHVCRQYPDTAPSRLYGAVHLLRLFVRLGSLFACTTLDEKGVQLATAHAHDFLKYMLVNRATLLSLQDYTAAPPDYHSRAH